MAKKIYKSITGYSCPNCDAICSNQTLESRTAPELTNGPEAHYEWSETHKCFKCHTLYVLNNGT